MLVCEALPCVTGSFSCYTPLLCALGWNPVRCVRGGRWVGGWAAGLCRSLVHFCLCLCTRRQRRAVKDDRADLKEAEGGVCIDVCTWL